MLRLEASAREGCFLIRGLFRFLVWYFMTENMGGLAVLTCSALFGYGKSGFLSLRGLLALLYWVILMRVAANDWDRRVIRDGFSVEILVLGMAALWLFPEHSLGDRLVGMVAAALPMLGLALCREGAFGGGDIKLMSASGFFLGGKGILAATFWGMIGSGVYGLWLLAGGKRSRKDRLALGPFLAMGLVMAFFLEYAD